MQDKTEPMSSLEEFKASFDRRLAFYSDCICSGKIFSKGYGDSNFMVWFEKYSFFLYTTFSNDETHHKLYSKKRSIKSVSRKTDFFIDLSIWVLEILYL